MTVVELSGREEETEGAVVMVVVAAEFSNNFVPPFYVSVVVGC